MNQHILNTTTFLKYACFRPANEQYPLISAKLQAAVESVVTQTATPEQAVQKLVEDGKRSVGEKKHNNRNRKIIKPFSNFCEGAKSLF